MLVYSTCSILKEENENVLDAVLSQSGGELMPIDKNRFTCVPELDGMAETVTVCPDEWFEGFFLALIKKIK